METAKTVEQLLSELEDNYLLINKALENFKKCPKSRLTKGYLEVKLKSFDDYWDSFRTANQQLMRLVPKAKRKEIAYFVNDDYSRCEEEVMDIKAVIMDMIESKVISSTIASRSPSKEQNTLPARVKLPNIQLKTFSGAYEEWPAFQDLFKSLVDMNTTLNNVQKLHYLKVSLTGEAESLLKSIQVTDQNYELAWNILKNRYNNKRLIVTSLLKRLFNQKKSTTQYASYIKSLHDTTCECLNSLKNLGLNIESWDPLIIHLVVQKLDASTHKEWEEYVTREGEELPQLSSLLKFLQSRFRTLELVTTSTIKEKPVIKERTYHISTTERTCPLCKEKHGLYHCKQFGRMEPAQRSEFVKNKFICYNCLVPGHILKSCRLSSSCQICHKRHHTLLHTTRTDTAKGTTETSQPTDSKVSLHLAEDSDKIQVNTITQQRSSKRGTTLLATAVVTAKGENGHTTVLRALIDPGSQGCFITERAAQTLKAKRYSTQASIIGVGYMKTKLKHVVQVEIQSRYEQFSMTVKAYIISKQLTSNIPTKSLTYNNWPHLKGLVLADPRYHSPGAIDILLGVDEYSQIIQNDVIKGPPGSPCAQKTTLGWILFGKVDDRSKPEESIVVMHHNIEVEDMLKTLWDIDTDTKRKYTHDEELCEKMYKDTYKRNNEGRYIVKLPFKTQRIQSPYGNTEEIALRRLEQLQKRLQKSPELEKRYREVIEEYLKMEHMEEVPNDELTAASVYLPHHAVVRLDRETTKTRVVFDASCKGINGISLNDELLTGPVLQEDLRSIIMRWRTHKICFTSDIEKMYRMILVTKEDSNFQRVLWKTNTSTSDEVKHYRLLTVTFGTASAPYLAVKTLMQLADDEGESYPIGARIIHEDFYVDDCMSGADNVNEAIKASTQLRKILEKGKFNLQKWCSNSIDFMKSIEPSDRSSKAAVDISIDGTVKALGLSWNLKTDKFHYTLTPPTSSTVCTKRSILADLQRLFDPLGWIAPAVVIIKILIQKLWLRGSGWDDQIDQDLEREWNVIRKDLNNVHEIRIQRWLNTYSHNKNNTTLHGFSDASMHAMAAVVYCRVIKADNTVCTRIVAARSKVAPVKQTSIPRLELCAAALLSKLLNHTAKAMRIPNSQVYAWTDSSVTLAWLTGDPHRWKTFVANRVVEIQDNINSSQWYHVQSEHNPADIASRGSTITNLRDNQLWWHGPHWLSVRNIEFKRPNDRTTNLERRKTIANYLNIPENLKNEKEFLDFENYDNLDELLRIIVHSIRFLNSKKNVLVTKAITTEELDKAHKICIIRSQKESFEEDLEYIRRHAHVKRKSQIKSLNPYIDEDGILRVGGRLRHAHISQLSKHPVILHTKNSLTYLIVADAHQKTLHGGVQLVLCYLRTRYWILKSKSLVKTYLRRCLTCRKIAARSKTQIMGDLPKVRVTPARPFLHSGVDFAGPYDILMSKGRGGKTSKAYIAIFVCMSIKAVHLELVGDLTAEAFIGSFKRFVGRRGRCSHIYSDQGRNFIAANKELTEAWKAAQLELKDEVADILARDGTQWHFIPAYSPNFGGLWEAAVKSLKYHLKRILMKNLTYEEMTTLLCQIESCLNSRPMSPIDDSDTENIDSLTPGHFLIGEAPVTIPSPNLKDVNINHLTRWKFTQKLLNDFWHKWQVEYLTKLQQRPKWMKPEEEFQLNDVVLIKQPNLPPGKWLLGRIMEKHPGQDGATRVYSVKSGATVTKRCVTKLCPLLKYDE